jgi:hypothetical protein
MKPFRQAFETARFIGWNYSRKVALGNHQASPLSIPVRLPDTVLKEARQPLCSAFLLKARQ